MSPRNTRQSILSASIGLAFLVAAGAATAQATSTTSTPSSTQGMKAGSGQSMNAGASIPAADKSFVEKAAVGGLAEVEMGKMAQQKGSSDQVKQFGSRMVDDHSKANDELKQIASSKGITLPTDLDAKHKSKMEKMQKLSGAQFDRAYMDDMVSDHKQDVADFKKEANSGKDSDIKAFAAKTLPTLEDHLKMAQSTESAVKANKTASR
jgi:putative membrane protein